MTRNRITIVTAVLAALALVALGVGPAAETPQTVTPVPGAAEMERLSKSLERISEALEAMLHSGRVDVLLKRIELAERRLAPLEGELRSARDDVRSTREEVGRLEQFLKDIEKEVEQRILAGENPQDLDERVMTQQIERELNLQRRRLEGLERRERELEDDLDRGRERIEILDEQLEELIAG